MRLQQTMGELFRNRLVTSHADSLTPSVDWGLAFARASPE